MGTGSFLDGKVRPERAADHSPPSSAAVMEELSYTSTHPLGPHWACNGITLPLPFYCNMKFLGMLSFKDITVIFLQQLMFMNKSRKKKIKMSPFILLCRMDVMENVGDVHLS